MCYSVREGMICEMCGRDVPQTRTVVGEDYRSSTSGGAPVTQSVIEERLEKREKRMKSKDIYAGTTSIELVDDYGGVIRAAREAKGLDQEKFAASILEKKGTIAKIESNSLVPNDKLIKKIEKALGIKLTEAVQSGVTVGPGGAGNKMTLANFIKKS